MSFASQFDSAVVNINAEIAANVGEIAGQLFGRIVYRSPVDTGIFRLSWKIEGVQGGYRIYNPLPYGPTLEYGGYTRVGNKTVASGEGIYSRQAPHGMVRVSIEEVKIAYGLL